MMPGMKPASATPSRKRSVWNDQGACTSAMPQATSPQVTMMRAIHSRAPTRRKMRLLGTSHSTYPAKNTPAPRPNTLLEKPSSWLSEGAAKETLTRSRYATTYSKNR